MDGKISLSFLLSVTIFQIRTLESKLSKIMEINIEAGIWPGMGNSTWNSCILCQSSWASPGPVLDSSFLFISTLGGSRYCLICWILANHVRDLDCLSGSHLLVSNWPRPSCWGCLGSAPVDQSSGSVPVFQTRTGIPRKEVREHSA